MEPDRVDILRKGDESGNGLVARFRLPSGLDVYSLPTENYYGGHWDLGPTWNYLVMADPPFLVDSGRRGQTEKLIAMLGAVGVEVGDLGFVLVSHGHEDHDGGLAQLTSRTGLPVRAHRFYARLIRRYPEMGPGGVKKRFPAKCWHCLMPPSFFEIHCLEYHSELQQLRIDPVGDGQRELQEGFWTHHLPGHSPDCLALRVDAEAVLVGDVVLPDISPWPTRQALFEQVAGVLGPGETAAGELFGLPSYLHSLQELIELSGRFGRLQVFPAHRLFYRGRWNGIDLKSRALELLDHHLQRCGAVLEILAAGPENAAGIARAYFEPDLLKGLGQLMAENEIESHCELLAACGDIRLLDDGRYEAGGSRAFENHPGFRRHR